MLYILNAIIRVVKQTLHACSDTLMDAEMMAVSHLIGKKDRVVDSTM